MTRSQLERGRERARQLYPEIGDCEMCGDVAVDRHHINGDTLDNRRANVAFLCRTCHMEADGRLEKLKEAGERARQKKMAATHCKNGHSLDDAYRRPDRPNNRGCRQCRAEAESRRRARLRERFGPGAHHLSAEQRENWRRCPHIHPTREGREACEKRLNGLVAA